jgi:hypothetical protein
MASKDRAGFQFPETANPLAPEHFEAMARGRIVGFLGIRLRLK